MKYLLFALLMAGCEDCLSNVNNGCRVACSHNSMNPDFNCYKACINTTMPRCSTEASK